MLATESPGTAHLHNQETSLGLADHVLIYVTDICICPLGNCIVSLFSFAVAQKLASPGLYIT